MLEQKFMPSQVSHMMKRTIRGKQEKKRVAEVSTHKSPYRYSSDDRHEWRVYNAHTERRSGNVSFIYEAEEMSIEDEEIVIQEIMDTKCKQHEEMEELYENSFDSDEFTEKVDEE